MRNYMKWVMLAVRCLDEIGCCCDSLPLNCHAVAYLPASAQQKGILPRWCGSCARGESAWWWRLERRNGWGHVGRERRWAKDEDRRATRRRWLFAQPAGEGWGWTYDVRSHIQPLRSTFCIVWLPLTVSVLNGKYKLKLPLRKPISIVTQPVAG